MKETIFSWFCNKCFSAIMHEKSTFTFCDHPVVVGANFCHVMTPQIIEFFVLSIMYQEVKCKLRYFELKIGR